MGEFSKLMKQALDAVSAMSPEHQDLLAVELMDRARVLASPPTNLSREDMPSWKRRSPPPGAASLRAMPT